MKMTPEYYLPDGEEFFIALIEYLRSKNETKLITLLEEATCELVGTSQFSKVRWNTYSAFVHFYVKPTNLNLFDDKMKMKLLENAYEILPENTGYVLKTLKITPKLGFKSESQPLEEAITKIQTSTSSTVINEILSNDLIQKGQEMSEVYFFLYCAENAVRRFISKVVDDSPNVSSLDDLNLNIDTLKNINIRKKQEKRHAWLPLRGDSDLYYMDFVELNKLIINNWKLFESYFPQQSWIQTRIEEMAQIRHLVAHNSYVGTKQKKHLETYFQTLIDQISSNY